MDSSWNNIKALIHIIFWIIHYYHLVSKGTHCTKMWKHGEVYQIYAILFLPIV